MTDQVVQAAVSALIERGEKPTLRAVMAITGGGSAIVHKTLKELNSHDQWMAFVKRPQQTKNLSDPPVGLTNELLELKKLILDLRSEVFELRRSLSSETKGITPKAPTQTTNSAIKQKSVKIPKELETKNIREASIIQLEREKKPLTSREIANLLTDQGFDIFRSDKAKSVQQVLYRYCQKSDYVILVGRGKWGLKKWYSKAELDEISQNLGGTPSRDFEHHQNMIRHAQQKSMSRGVQFGREKFAQIYPIEVIKNFLALKKSGCTVDQALQQSGLKKGTYNRYSKIINRYHQYENDESFFAAISEKCKLINEQIYKHYL